MCDYACASAFIHLLCLAIGRMVDFKSSFVMLSAEGDRNKEVIFFIKNLSSAMNSIIFFSNFRSQCFGCSYM